VGVSENDSTVTEPAGGVGTAAGLIERAAAAFAAAIPEEPADDGYFGPGSVTWRLAADLSGPAAGLRSLLLQALHPLAMAGVEQHSDWRADPVARYASTLKYVVTTTYGDRAAADRAAAVVRKIHERVRGTDTVTGKPYAAGDPDLLLWVHAIEVESTLRTAILFGTEVTSADADQYVAEMTAAAELVGVPAASFAEGGAPASVAELDAYFAAVRPALATSQSTEDTATYLIGMPDVEPELAEVWEVLAAAAVASLPGWARDMYGFGTHAADTGRAADTVRDRGAAPPGREEVRQVLGVLDAVYLGEPGVLEARQRLTLRMRAAQDSRAQTR
jgi:uncharacterized protein (DUF2236 family)